MAASAQSVFDAAVKDFQDELPNQDAFDFRGFETIDDVYREIDRTQEEQGRKGQLRYMKRIEPFLSCLEQYSAVLDTFVQVKANVLALIWVGKTYCTCFGDLLLNVFRAQSNFFFKYECGLLMDGRANHVQVSRNYVKGFDKVVEMTRKIGDCLPRFRNCEALFTEHKGVRDILYLFYKDILDFYAIMLRFFQTKGMFKEYQLHSWDSVVC